MTTIQVPIKPHLRKYVLKKLEVKEPTIRLSTTDKMSLGIIVINSLCRKDEHYIEVVDNHISKFLNAIPEKSYLNFSLGSDYAQRYGMFVPKTKVFTINKFLENFFANEMFTFIHSLILHDPNIVVKFALDDFVSIYDINEDDIQFSSIYKLFNRYKNEYSYIK